METTAFITLDLQRLTYNRIRAKQNDTWRRRVNIAVLSDGREANVSETAEFVVQYIKPDGTRGFYTHLPDGSLACTSQSNDIYMTMAPQMLTVAGEVSCSIAMLDEDHQVLQTFSFFIDVEESEGAGVESEDYVKAPTLQNILNLIDKVSDDLVHLQDELSSAKEVILSNSGSLEAVTQKTQENYEAIEGLKSEIAQCVKTINKTHPGPDGSIYLSGEDIPALPGNIPNVEDGSSIDDHFEALGNALFHCSYPLNSCFKASNGKNYTFDVDADGKMIAVEV